jgi:hypothetical protein
MEPIVPPPPPPAPRTAPGAVWSLVLGILSLVCFSILTGIPAIICGHLARGKIQRSQGSLTGAGLALAGLITGYVSVAMLVFVIPMLAAIAIPNFNRARDMVLQNACISNLRQLDGAIQTWAVEHKQVEGAVVKLEDIQPYLRGQVVCPRGGTYQLGTVGGKPTCSIPGHTLPPE